MNAEWIAFVDKQCDATVLTEETRLRLNHARLIQLPQRPRVTHEDVGIEARRTAYIEREVADGNSSGAYHLHEVG